MMRAVGALAMAACAAALGDARSAIAELQRVTLHQGTGHSDRAGLVELYLANDWDRLRGTPKFDSLFVPDL